MLHGAGIFTYIYHKNEPNVGNGNISIHGASGYVSWMVHDVLIAEIGPENGRADCTGWANFQVPPLSENDYRWFENDYLPIMAILKSTIYCQCRNYRTEVEEYEGTVIYRTLLFYNSVFLGRCEKKRIWIYS